MAAVKVQLRCRGGIIIGRTANERLGQFLLGFAINSRIYSSREDERRARAFVGLAANKVSGAPVNCVSIKVGIRMLSARMNGERRIPAIKTVIILAARAARPLIESVYRGLEAEAETNRRTLCQIQLVGD
jgi:hypothetical protein